MSPKIALRHRMAGNELPVERGTNAGFPRNMGDPNLREPKYARQLARDVPRARPGGSAETGTGKFVPLSSAALTCRFIGDFAF